MNNKDILYKVIVKAEANGYNSEAGLSLVTLTRNALQPDHQGDITAISLDLEYLELNVFIPYIIFSHDFAKAFWGEKKDWLHDGEYESDWEFYLKEMVLEKEPLKYLEKFL